MAEWIDDDYIDVEKERADLSESEDSQDDDIDRSLDSVEDHSDTDMSHRMDVRDGSGASPQIDELIDENAIIEHDGRADTRTFFYPGEAPKKRQRKFRRLIRWQEGEGQSSRKADNRAADRRRFISTAASKLDLTDYQRERVLYIIEDLNMSHMAHYSSEKVILAVISLVANADNRFIRDEGPFRRLMTEVDTDLDELKNVRGLVRDKSDSV